MGRQAAITCKPLTRLLARVGQRIGQRQEAASRQQDAAGDHPTGGSPTTDHRERLGAARQTLGSDIEAFELLGELRDRLGTDSPLLADPDYETTPKGRVAIHAGGLLFFRDERDGTPVASRAGGGRAEFAYVAPDGLTPWQLVPLGDVSSN